MNVREVALKAIYNIEKEEAYFSAELKKALENSSISDKDKGLLTEIIYGVIKNRLFLDYVISAFSKIKLNKLSDWVLNILRIGVYQIIFLDRIPESAACNESVKLAKKYSNKGGYGFVNGVLRTIVRNKDSIKLPDEKADILRFLSVKYSYPQWLVKKLVEQFGQEKAEKFMNESNLPHGTDIRVNILKTNLVDITKLFDESNIKYEVYENAENIISVKSNVNLTLTKEYKEGLFSLQNSSSKSAVDILKPEAGNTVIDVCAAPGGKSCAMAEIMQNKGRIYSFDLYEHKKELILNSAKRLGIDIIEASVFDATILNESLLEKADKVLVDAPCSGIGVIHKKPDIKWKRKETDIKELSAIQKSILHNASKYVKSGGELLYSTCTVLKEENEEVIKEFLRTEKNFRVNFEKQILTSEYGESGFYICKMQKA